MSGTKSAATDFYALAQILEYYPTWRKESLQQEDSIINTLFQGDLLTSIRCCSCSNTSYNFEKFGELPLNLHREASVINLSK